ncbi:HAD hydrolase-like protein [Pontibacterium granulatum]|uniref:HAD family hydrolase n=1 Tax=Pontibacterium granulatum TaxID=2036029 RepID=UPI00249BB289|nr:HAD hydrolase-like protein [Pontibacterium granulatum]MDI3325665.1 HAD hydrolase-like protein [Pontibacterium granulatum]
MHLVMFDIDGTLIESYDFDEQCFLAAIDEVLGIQIDARWDRYPHVTDAGILDEILSQPSYLPDRALLEVQIRASFMQNLTLYLENNSVEPIAGAIEFLEHLKQREDVVLAIATGGWYESATMKLEAAGLDVNGIALATSSDHIARVEIMKLAEARAAEQPLLSRTYFGDAAWDKKASRALDYNFVLLGDRVEHHQAMSDYLDIETATRFIGLE